MCFLIDLLYLFVEDLAILFFVIADLLSVERSLKCFMSFLFAVIYFFPCKVLMWEHTLNDPPSNVYQPK